MANNVNSVESGSSIGNPIHNSTPVKSSFIHRHNQSAGLFDQAVISDKKNVSLGSFQGAVNLNILTDTSSEDLKEIERLTKKLQTGQQKLREVEALNEALTTKQNHLQQRVNPFTSEVREQETQVRNISRKYNTLLKKYEHCTNLFGLKEPDDAEEFLGLVKKLGPSYDDVCNLCDTQRETLTELYKKLDDLSEEKQSFTWKHAIEKEQEVQLKSERYLDTFKSSHAKSTLRLEEQEETINGLKEDLELVEAENEKLSLVSHIKKLQQMCNDLDEKLKNLLHSNQDMKKKNNELVLQNKAATRAKVSETVTSRVIPSIEDQDEEAKQTLHYYKQKCLTLQRELNRAHDVDNTILDTDMTLIPEPTNMSYNKSHSTVMSGISSQVNDVKNEVKSMKEVLKQSKKALQGLLPKTGIPGESQVLNKSTETPSSAGRRLIIKQRLNRTH